MAASTPVPTELGRDFGMAWGVGGFLLTPFLQKIGAGRRAAAAHAGRERTEDDLREPLREGDLAARSAAAASIAAYNKRATGEKYLINPNKG